MGGTKLVCKEHNITIGGCDCPGARIVLIPCPSKFVHETQLKELDEQGNR